jgi:hypothetical protein
VVVAAVVVTGFVPRAGAALAAIEEAVAGLIPSKGLPPMDVDATVDAAGFATNTGADDAIGLMPRAGDAAMEAGLVPRGGTAMEAAVAVVELAGLVIKAGALTAMAGVGRADDLLAIGEASTACEPMTAAVSNATTGSAGAQR